MDDLEAAVRVTEAAIAHLTHDHIVGSVRGGQAEEAGGQYGKLFAAIYKAVLRARREGQSSQDSS